MSMFTPSPQQLAALVDEYPLAWVVSPDPTSPAATPLPLLGVRDHDGALIALEGHFGRSNRQVALLERESRATILFQGPEGYISPRLVSRPFWGPTWNYAVARFEVQVTMMPDDLDASLARLARHLEGDGDDAWTPDMMGDRYAPLAARIIPFQARIVATEARFKLGQDESDETFADIVTGLGDSELARWMRRLARPRD